ncbi:hypothetical protein F4604DRAFT_1915992 [Suillus subluteus]|nr:hypothetical protein F4604DRAFT_1915992 [Suillus subluteus]
MESLQELQDDACTSLQVFLDSTGHPSNVGKMRTVVTELQSELAQTQQVANLLREKLQNMGSELIDTWMRLTELEGRSGNDRKLIASTTSNLECTSKRVADMTEYLKLQRNETIEALTKLAEVENREECEVTIHSMQEMKSMRQEISEHEGGKAQIQILQNIITQHKKDLEGQLQNAKAVQQDLTSEGESIRERLQMTEVELADIRNLEMESSGQSVRLMSECDTLLDKLKTACTQLADVKRKEDSYVKETLTSFKALQQHFNDQLITLRLTKESVGEVQDRLQSTNGAILALNATLAESNNRTSAAGEREHLLQHILDEANIAMNSLCKELSDWHIDLYRQQGIQQATEQIAEQRAHNAKPRIQEDSQCGELGEKQQVISDLTQRAKTPDQQEPQHADWIPFEMLVNGNPDIQEFENEKDLTARQVKRTIPPKRSTRPARQLKFSKSLEMEKATDEVGVFSHRLSSCPKFVSGPRFIKEEDEQATRSVVSRDGLHPVPHFTIQQTPEGWSSVF